MGWISHGSAGPVQRVFWMAALIWLILPPRSSQADTPAVCNAADPNQVRLQVSVSGVHSTKGNITITIYPDEPSHFLDGKYRVTRQHVAATLPVTRTCFVVPAPGYYAVALFHDKNNTGHFETTLLGLPAEGFGFSNNPTLYFGPPDLSRVRFYAHPGDNLIAIQLKYY
jgi:uncharacterized protein (DUF2141 family)